MKSIQEQTKVLENFYNNLCITNVISREDVLSLESALGSNLITNVRDVKWFSNSKTNLNVSEVKDILKKSIQENKLHSTITQEKLYDKANEVRCDVEYVGKKIHTTCASIPLSVIDFFKMDKYFLRYTQNEGVEELVNLKDKGIFEVLVCYPEIADALAKNFTNPEVFLDDLGNIVHELNKNINNGESILEIDPNKLNFVTDFVLSNILYNNTSNNNLEDIFYNNTRITELMTVNNFVKLIENLKVTNGFIKDLMDYLDSFSEFRTYKNQDTIDNVYYFLDSISMHYKSSYNRALYLFINILGGNK